MPYEFLPHTAEIKIRSSAESFPRALEELASAIADFLTRGNAKKLPEKNLEKIKEISFEKNDLNALTYNFIEEILFELDANEMVVLRAKVSELKGKMKVEFYGLPARKFRALEYIKSPTYSEMRVIEKDGKATIEVVLDV
ncbi:archease [Candidatus Pacearchaeota archaeon]|nr:MAG: archease [Candidatus Pacearchaeota archaeon]